MKEWGLTKDFTDWEYIYRPGLFDGKKISPFLIARDWLRDRVGHDPFLGFTMEVSMDGLGIALDSLGIRWKVAKDVEEDRSIYDKDGANLPLVGREWECIYTDGNMGTSEATTLVRGLRKMS